MIKQTDNQHNRNIICTIRFAKFSRKLILLFFLSIFLQSCVAYSRSDLLNNNYPNPNIKKSFQFDWIGFAKYPEEKELLRKNFISMGILESKNSKELMEIIFDEKEVFYDYPIFHFGNFLFSFFSGTVIPYHTITEHSLSIRMRNATGIFFESKSTLVLNQWRGILLIPLTPFFWPTNEFNKILDLETKKMMIEYQNNQRVEDKI